MKKTHKNPSLLATTATTETSEKNVKKPLQPKNQAERIFSKFGNATRLWSTLTALGRPYNRASIYKWGYPRSRGGTGGWIPTKAWPDILAAARFDGVFITSQEMDPRTYNQPKPKYVRKTKDKK